MKPRPSADLELEEILVKGRRPINNAQRMTSWLSRLVGEFRYEGHVERRGEDGAVDRAEVHGGSRCSNLGAPGLVQCRMNVSWQEKRETDSQEIPGGTSFMVPAIALYGMYLETAPAPGVIPDPRYIGHAQVDSRGVAEAGLGQLYDDTLIYKARCADLPGDCLRVVQIEAPPDGRVIRMSVDVQRESKTAVRYVFEWNRVPPTAVAGNDLAVAGAATTADSVASGSIVPVDTQIWLKRLIGRFQFVHIREECVEKKIIDAPCPPPDTSSREECQGIGSGVGVRCLRDLGELEAKVPASRLKAAFGLWGYDPAARNVVHITANPRAMGGLGGVSFHDGKLEKDTLTYMAPCPGVAACQTNRITAEPDGRYVTFQTDMAQTNGLKGKIKQSLFRIVSTPADAAPVAPRVNNPSPRRP